MKGKIIIVDENDVIIGHKTREEVLPGDIYRVSALWIENSVGDILLAQRKYTKKKDPGKWGPAVAGTNEEGETYLSNIIKETEEEVGLSGYAIVTSKKTRIHSERSNYFGHWFTLVVDLDISKFTIQEEEVEQVAWYSKERLKLALKKEPEKFLATMKESFEYFCSR